MEEGLERREKLQEFSRGENGKIDPPMELLFIEFFLGLKIKNFENFGL